MTMNIETKRGYYPDGNLLWEDCFMNNVQHGTSKWFMRSGEVNWIDNFFQGEKEGEVIFFDYGFKLVTDVVQINTSSSYYRNGQLKREYAYINNNIKHGINRSWHKNGELKRASQFEDGVTEGEVVFNI